VRRVDTLLIDYMGAEDSEYLRAVTRKTLVAAVARVFRPGIKLDYVLTLVGVEGLGKSNLVARLGGKWFSDTFSFHMLRNKEAYEQVVGFWIIEIPELSGLKKTEVEAAKHFLTKTTDSYRPAYGKNTVDYVRQCIFIGSTNSLDFLRGQEGNRRFWPVTAGVNQAAKNVFKLTGEEINQIWAEAYEYFLDGEKLYLPAELEKVAKEIQAEHTEKDGRVPAVEKFLEMPLPENWYEMDTWERRAYMEKPTGVIERDRVCIQEIWETLLRGDLRDLTIMKAKEVHNLMKQVKGWKEHQTKIKFKVYGVCRGYVKNTFAKK
jgi:putative DNA primase/helicase